MEENKAFAVKSKNKIPLQMWSFLLSTLTDIHFTQRRGSRHRQKEENHHWFSSNLGRLGRLQTLAAIEQDKAPAFELACRAVLELCTAAYGSCVRAEISFMDQSWAHAWHFAPLSELMLRARAHIKWGGCNPDVPREAFCRVKKDWLPRH